MGTTRAGERYDTGELAARLASVHGRVRRAAEAAGRDPAEITVLAVTKGHGVAAAAAAVAVGLRDVGESRVQEAQSKRAESGGDGTRWHMIGHLQRNKARAAAALFDAVHSVDSVALARLLDVHRPAGLAPLAVYIEVDLSGIAGRSGVTPEAAPALLDELVALPRLQVVGLMTIAPPGPPAAAASCFADLRQLRDRLRDGRALALDGLSMGMSEDFEVAIGQGATIIRLGRALFGDRHPAGT